MSQKRAAAPQAGVARPGCSAELLPHQPFQGRLSLADRSFRKIVLLTVQILEQIPQLCVLFHESVQVLGDKFLAKERRHVYVTPTSYLELSNFYKKMLGRKQDEVGLCCCCAWAGSPVLCHCMRFGAGSLAPHPMVVEHSIPHPLQSSA